MTNVADVTELRDNLERALAVLVGDGLFGVVPGVAAVLQVLGDLGWVKGPVRDAEEVTTFAEQTIRYVEGLAKGDVHPAELTSRKRNRDQQIKAAQQDFDATVKTINQTHIVSVLALADEARKKRVEGQ
jgi:hypothetical protein